MSEKKVRKAKGMHLLLSFCTADFRHCLKELYCLSLSLRIPNPQHRVSGSAHWCSKGRRIASTLELLGSSKKAQAQVKIALLYSGGVTETFPEVSSKPCPWACCPVTSSRCSPEGWASRGQLCRLTPWEVHGQRVSMRRNIWSWLWGYITPLKLWSV